MESVKMNEKMRNKALKVLELAMLINSGKTKRELTGNRPTVFVCFSGHCCDLDVQIHLDGWDWREPYCRENINKSINLAETQEKEIDEVIDILQKLYNEWGENDVIRINKSGNGTL